MGLIQELEAEAIAAFNETKSIPEFRPGDTLRVGVRDAVQPERGDQEGERDDDGDHAARAAVDRTVADHHLRILTHHAPRGR